MGWLLALFFVVILVAAVIVCVLLHAGFFSDLRIRTSVPASLPSRIAYKVYRGGPYSKVGGSLSTLSAIAPKQTLLCIFYDDPKKVPKAELRYIVGCSLPDTAGTTIEKTLTASGYSLWTFPKCNKAVITEFLDRSFVSCIIAPKIVYPALHRYFQQFDMKIVGPVVEVYIDGYILYVTPLDNIEGFFVPEFAQQNESKKTQ